MIEHDEKIRDNFLLISKKKYISPKNFYVKTHFETQSILSYEGLFYITIGSRTVKTIIVNVRLTGVLFVDTSFTIYSRNKKGELINIEFGKENIKKHYDGTTFVTIDVSQIDCKEFIETTISKGGNYISFNNLTLEFEESFLSIDYKSYKNAILDYIY